MQSRSPRHETGTQRIRRARRGQRGWLLAMAAMLVVDGLLVSSAAGDLWRGIPLATLGGPILRAKINPEPAAFLPALPPAPERAEADTAGAEALSTRSTAVRPGQTLLEVLGDLGLPAEQALLAARALAQLTSLRGLRPGELVSGTWRGSQIVSVELRRGAVSLTARREGPGWVPQRRELEAETSLSTVRGVITSSLWEAVLEAGESPALVAEFADIFSWEIDFFSEPRAGDRFSLVLERRVIDGQPLPDHARILAAAYVGQRRTYQAYRHGPHGHYYDQDGAALAKAFLRAPLQYARVTSGYGRRIHPVLGYSRLHAGIDYRAPIGTPVWAVGDGTVTTVARDRVSGLYIVLRHPQGYETVYAHLASASVRRGDKVRQKQTIAQTGNSGRSTGPHLHYGMNLNKRPVNPATQRFPAGQALEPSARRAFEAAVRELQPLLLARLPAPTGAALASAEEP